MLKIGWRKVGQTLSRYLQNSPQLLAYARGSERMSYRAATVRSCEKIGSQAKAPAPLNRKSLCVNVGQTLPSANPARVPIFSQLLREPVLLGSSYFASTSLSSANPLLLATALLFALTLAAQSPNELRFCLRGDPKTFNPLLVEDENSETVLYLTGGVLIRLNRYTQELEGELATKWKVSENGRRIDFELRPERPVFRRHTLHLRRRRIHHAPVNGPRRSFPSGGCLPLRERAHREANAPGPLQ